MEQFVRTIGDLWNWLVAKLTSWLGAVFGFDPTAVVPWAQLSAALLAMVASGWAILNLWRRAEDHKRKLLTSFLDAEERRVHERKAEIARRFLAPKTTTERVEGLNVDAELDAALSFHERGKIKKAERILMRLLDSIKERRDIAGRQAEVARQQVGAIHLFRGALFASQGRPSEAIDEFKEARRVNDGDFDAQRYVVEQYIVWADSDLRLKQARLIEASNQLAVLEAETGSSKERQAIALILKGRLLERQGNLKLAYTALGEAVTAAKESESLAAISLACERLASVAEHPSLDYWKIALANYQESACAYEKIGQPEDQLRVQQRHDELLERKRGGALTSQVGVAAAPPISPKGQK
jgi:tetratricopeptide (TPR) repeat protein